jgi:hypothetical protein
MAFYIVHPTTDTPDRLLTAPIVRAFTTAAEAFAAIEWLKLELRRTDVRNGRMELVIVDEQWRPVVDPRLT